MAAKKERGRFSLRFNIGDPVQRAAVELLELQPPHSKAQYIANALVYYNTHFSDDPQPLKVPAIDRAAIEAIAREIMRQDGQASDKVISTGESSPSKKNNIAPPPQEQTTEPSTVPVTSRHWLRFPAINRLCLASSPPRDRNLKIRK